jgi:hypothetical protein
MEETELSQKPNQEKPETVKQKLKMTTKTKPKPMKNKHPVFFYWAGPLRNLKRYGVRVSVLTGTTGAE